MEKVEEVVESLVEEKVDWRDGGGEVSSDEEMEEVRCCWRRDRREKEKGRIGILGRCVVVAVVRVVGGRRWLPSARMEVRVNRCR